MKKENKSNLGITNMNGLSGEDDRTCGLQNMNCMEQEEKKNYDITDMNAVGKDDDITCALQDMNCTGDQ